MATIVISYSREDRNLVKILVQLLRAGLREIDEAVFWDDDIAPGDRWRNAFRAKVETAGQLFVIWCGHSARSREVTREYGFALQRNIRTVPILLDSTPLATRLAPLNGIDPRGVLIHKYREDVGPRGAPIGNATELIGSASHAFSKDVAHALRLLDEVAHIDLLNGIDLSEVKVPSIESPRTEEVMLKLVRELHERLVELAQHQQRRVVDAFRPYFSKIQPA